MLNRRKIYSEKLLSNQIVYCEVTIADQMPHKAVIIPGNGSGDVTRANWYSWVNKVRNHNKIVTQMPLK